MDTQLDEVLDEVDPIDVIELGSDEVVDLGSDGVVDPSDGDAVFDESIEGAELDADEGFEIITDESTGITIILTWVTEGDDTVDEGDGLGSNLDLHFLHPDGMWDDRDGFHRDCHWKNTNPNWGDPEDEDDDPQLVRVDSDGWGPEYMVYEQPEGTEGEPIVYQIGVFHFSDNGYGPSDATVEVYVDDVQQGTFSVENLLHRYFWPVASIRWPFRTADEDLVEMGPPRPEFP